jgi:biotin-dependent carboxylase-like uncharacterized protein
VFEVLDPGLLSTIQDLGRAGYEDVGVPRSGACDRRSLAIANHLQGNRPGAAAVELTLGGLTIRAIERCTIGLAGADLGAILDGRRHLEVGAGHLVPAGSTVGFTGGAVGARAYLSLAGGVDCAPVLGSAATYVPAGLGGFGGRALAAGDRLVPGRRGDVRAAGRRWSGATVLASIGRPLAVLPGPDPDRFGPEGLAHLTRIGWTVGSSSDRMGVRLEGPEVPRRGADALVSYGVPDGAIQVPADGVPILLLADHQTIGGYPVLAVVATVDLPRAGQLRPGDPVRFEAIDVSEAHRRLRKAEDELERAVRAMAADDAWEDLSLDAGG